MATAYMYLKQTPRARNQLKRVAKMNWTMEVGIYYEMSDINQRHAIIRYYKTIHYIERYFSISSTLIKSKLSM